MHFQKTAIATATAAVIALGTVMPTTSAEAAPFTPFSAASSQTATEVTEVGGRHRRRHRRFRRHHGAGVALGLGAFALGAAIASQSHRRGCFVERVRVWSPRYQAYVVRKKRVCY